MAYYWPSIVQLVVLAIVALLSAISAILGIVGITVGYWPSIGAIIYGAVTLGYCIFFFVCHKRSHLQFVSTKMDIISSIVLGVIGLFIGIFCGMVAIGTFVLLLGIGIFEAVYVGTRKISGKWDMSLKDLANVDVTGGAGGKPEHHMHQPHPQQFA